MPGRTDDDRFDELVGRVLDAEPREADIAELVELTRTNPARRESLARQLEADEMIALAEDDLRDSARFAAALEARLFGDPFVTRVRRGLTRRRVARAVLPWAAVAAVLLALALWRAPWQTTTVSASVAELVHAEGAIRWTGDGGRVETGPAAGRRLSGGTLESLAPDAWATLRFSDATEVTIAGDSSLTISGAVPDGRRGGPRDRPPQKHLYLTRGRLSAVVVPQPTGRPLVVSTPAATLEVTGKVRVAADAAATNVRVDAGAVRVERPLDGAIVDVPAAHRAIAPAAADEAVRVAATEAPVSSWTANLQAEANQGEWVDDLVALRRRLMDRIAAGLLTPQAARRQFADRASRGPLDARSGSLYAVRSPGASGLYVASLTLPPDRPAPVVLADGSRLRVRGRVRTPVDLVIGLGVGAPGGVATARAVAPPTRVEGEFDVVVPVDALRTRGVEPASPVGMELFTWFGWTRTPDAALEITNVELLAP